MDGGSGQFAREVLGLMQSEFTALRVEIGRLIDHQKDLQNLSLVSLGAVLAFIAAIAKLDTAQNDIALVLLLVPFLTLQFALTASDLSRKILDLAAYIEKLSADVNRIVAEADAGLASKVTVWGWESWKRDLFEKRSALRADHPNSTKPQRGWVVVAVDKAKWLSLLMPGVVSAVAYFAIDDAPRGGAGRLALSVVAVLALAAAAVLLSMYKSEATGVTSRTEVEQARDPTSL